MKSHDELRRFESLAITAIDNISGIGVSQYADHSKLLKSAFECGGVTESLGALKEKLESQKALQIFVSEEINDSHERNEKRMQGVIAVILLIIGLFQMLEVVNIIPQLTKGTSWVNLRDWDILLFGFVLIIFIALSFLFGLKILLWIYKRLYRAKLINNNILNRKDTNDKQLIHFFKKLKADVLNF
jgi:hypothetical protein